MKLGDLLLNIIHVSIRGQSFLFLLSHQINFKSDEILLQALIHIIHDFPYVTKYKETKKKKKKDLYKLHTQPLTMLFHRR